MSLIIPDGFAQVAIPIQHTLLARQAITTFGIDLSGFAGTDPQAADAVMTCWINFVQPVMDSNTTAGPAILTVGVTGGENIVVSGILDSTGADSQSSAPPSVAVLVNKITARGGRRGRGRMFVPWAVNTADVNEAGLIATAAVNNLEAAFGDFRTCLSVSDVDMVLLHNDGISDPGAPNAVTQVQVEALIGSQRRRLGR